MLPVISGILIAIVSAAVTVYLGRRAKSGRIDTTEAKDLWETLRGELTRLQAEATTLRAQLSTSYLEMTALREEASRVRLELAELRAVLDICAAENEALQDQAKARRRRVQ